MDRINNKVLSGVSNKIQFEPHANEELLKNDYLNIPLKNFIALNSCGDMFKGVSPLDIFYNKYYWYILFAKKYQEQFGFDAGIEQQEFKILEEAETFDQIDWVIIESIKKEVEL
jgi:hypothetical protein